jgi:hypothetical protein
MSAMTLAQEIEAIRLRTNVLPALHEELQRAGELHDPLCNAHEGIGALWEEVHELEAEVFHKEAARSYDRIRTEALHVAVVALRIAAMSASWGAQGKAVQP